MLTNTTTLPRLPLQITAEGLDEEQKKIIEVVPEKRSEGFLDNIGKMFNNN